MYANKIPINGYTWNDCIAILPSITLSPPRTVNGEAYGWTSTIYFRGHKTHSGIYTYIVTDANIKTDIGGSNYYSRIHPVTVFAMRPSQD